MSQITNNIINTIKQKRIAPKPRWHFIMRQVFIWLATVLSVIIGSLTFSVIIFRLVNDDWEFLSFIERSPLAHAMATLPYIWILFLGLFTALAYYNAKHTRGAYKFQGYWLVLLSVAVSLVVGGILYGVGIAPRIHSFSKTIPIFGDLMYDRDSLWMENDGFLAGQVVKLLDGDELLELQDLSDKYWIITTNDEYIPPPDFFILEEGSMIRIAGDKINDEMFEAERIMPYEMGPGVRKGGRPGGIMKRPGNPSQSPQLDYRQNQKYK